MVVSRDITNAEMAELYRFRARKSSGADKQRFLRLADLYILDDELVAGSRRAVDESRLLLTKLEKVKPWAA